MSSTDTAHGLGLPLSDAEAPVVIAYWLDLPFRVFLVLLHMAWCTAYKAQRHEYGSASLEWAYVTGC